MDMRQKRHETLPLTPAPGGPDPSGNPSLEEMRATAQHFLKAGSDAITRALSGGRSEEFLRANRQSGGE
ncbi:MAG: hypothetical protein KBE04_01085 [Phycisphaerae bacterium]|nr:hypothetical protein [Phycisphaerae bacterium]